MSSLRVLVYVNVLIALLACNVLSVRQGQRDDRVGVISKLGFVQKVMAKFFGCPPLSTASGSVTCTVKSKEVECNTKLPVGAKAAFSCDSEFYLTKSYNSIECKRGKTWDPEPPQCLPSPDPEAAKTTAFKETSTVVTETTAATTPTTAATIPTTAATIPTTTATFVREGHVNPFPTEPLLLPIRTRRYEGVGTLLVPEIPLAIVGQTINVTTAKKVCKDNNARLMSVDTVLARDALESMMILSHTKKGVWLDSTFDPPTKKYYMSPGVEFNPGMWCATEPTYLSHEDAIYFGYSETQPAKTYCLLDTAGGIDKSIMCRD